ncbi:MAG: DNA repair protein RecN, partial [Eubacterium sp.]|nr:DNA repair protein RecN [Eubacterium sp.]
MLKTLDIENIAVIEKTSVDFSEGLNVLTGETGAGKSIVVDSINAILGERTSKELVRHGAENAFVSAYFEDISDNAVAKLNELGFDAEEDNSLLITRKISALGKSSCKINGRAATVTMLRELSNALVNIHGQHDSQALLNPDYQYKYIDMLFDDCAVIEDYKNSFKKLIAVRRKLKSLTSSENDKEQQLELLDYQINELEQADIKIGEWEELTKRKQLISKSEAITAALNSALLAINGDDEVNGAQTLLNSCCNSLSAFDETLNITESLESANDSIEAAKDKIEKLFSSVEFNPAELEQIEERLDLLYEFSNKYGQTEEEMLSYLENAKKQRNSIMYADEELERLSAEYDELLDKTISLAQDLSNKRKAVAKDFEIKVKSELEFLDMPKLQFVVDFSKGKLSSAGFDKIEFLISTNPGEPPKPLSKIASGGELSRIMLAIKNILSYNDTIGTLI